MDKVQRARSSRTLVLLILAGLAYSGLLRLHVIVTGVARIDGILGVMLGLYAGAQPALHLIDALFYRESSDGREPRWTILGWWGLNLMVLLAAMTVIFTSLLRYSGQN
jgi:hypothetical protein